MTTEPVAPDVVGVSDDFPVTFQDPSDLEFTWEWDDMHMPFALSPLACDWAVMLGNQFEAWRTPEFAGYPLERRATTWNGYAYYGFRRTAEGPERDAWIARAVDYYRAREAVTEAYWNDEVVPELRTIYREMRAAPIEDGSLADVAAAWETGWAGAVRAWQLHFIVILGPYQIADDIADLYETVVPGAPAGEALHLLQGTKHELYESSAGIDRLVEVAAAAPAIKAALRAGVRAIPALADVPGGGPFVEQLEGFLAVHGHLGQSVDDLALASWGEEPALLMGEIAKRLDHPVEPAEIRRARLERSAIELADRARSRLADRPDDLARFEAVLALGRRIGPLTEVHNYWIDRASQAETRRLALRVGSRLQREGVLERADDVLYLHQDEIGPLLRAPSDQRSLIAARRADHDRHRQLRPPAVIGKPLPERPPDRFEGVKQVSDEADVLRGTGASAGSVRGPARIVLTSNEFDRIQPGDIIVCPSSNPSWVPVFTIAAGLVTNTGGVLSHAAVVAREFGLPAVVGVSGATGTIVDGREVEIDGTAGTVRLL
ncbi:MAG TPA: PEP-utilizing enzyme [Candidatus Limnocylindrales bacterium]